MRPLAGITLMLGVMSLASCGKTQPQSVVEPAAQVTDQDAAASDSSISSHTTADIARGDMVTDSESTTAHAHGHGVPVVGHQSEHDSHVKQTRQTETRRAHAHPDRSQSSRDDGKRIAIGDMVPDFEVSIAGRKWKLSELRQNKEITADGTLVLTFWCSFCHSCRHVEKSLDALAQEYRGKVGVIALDASAGETTEGVAEFARARELSLPIALDASGTSADVFGTRVTTTTVVIDKDGLLRYRGQFGDGRHSFALDALQAVLAGKDVPVHETRQKG